MKTTTFKLSLILTLGFIFSGCVVHRTVYVTPPPAEPIPMQTEVYEPQQTEVYVEQNDYYRAPDYVYSYYYCPEQNFYYNPESYSFWWYEGNGWRSGYELPYTYNIHSSTTYVIVEERDINPSKYNHNHVNYYRQGHYNNKTHRVGDNDKWRFERDAKTNNYYRKRDNNQQGGNRSNNTNSNVRPTGGGNQNNKGETNKQINQSTNHPQGNNGRYNQGNPNREVKPNQGTPPKSRETTPGQVNEKQQKKVRAAQQEEQGNTKIKQDNNAPTPENKTNYKQKENNRSYNEGNSNTHVRQEQQKPTRVQEGAPRQEKSKQETPVISEQKVKNNEGTPANDNNTKSKNRSGRQ